MCVNFKNVFELLLLNAMKNCISIKKFFGIQSLAIIIFK